MHQETRLRILAALARNRELSFGRLREALAVTDGNLGGHLARLEAAGYVETRAALAGLAFETRWRLTPSGTAAFRAYCDAVRAMLDEGEGESGGRGGPRSPATTRRRDDASG